MCIPTRMAERKQGRKEGKKEGRRKGGKEGGKEGRKKRVMATTLKLLSSQQEGINPLKKRLCLMD